MAFSSLFKGAYSNACLVALVLALAPLFFSGCKVAEVEKVARQNLPLPEDVQVVEDIEIGEYGGMFILSETTEPKTFNFIVPADQVSSTIQGYMSASLITKNLVTQNFEPALAKSYEVSEDGLTYTFHLRKGVKWSDGAPLTAHDLSFTFDAIFAKEKDADGNVVLTETGTPKYLFPSRHFASLTIGGEEMKYRVLDDHTIELSTAKVFAPFLSGIAGYPFMPRHKLQAYLEDGTLMKQLSSEVAIKSPEEIVSCGPFVIDSFRPGEHIVMKPNPHYWRVDKEGKRLPYVDYLMTKFVSDANAQKVLFTTGKLSTSGIAATDEPWIRNATETYDFTIYNQGPGAGISFMFFNQHLGKNKDGVPYMQEHKKNWFTNKKFRQAIMYAFNREGVAEGVYLGRARPLHSVIAPGNVKWHNPNVKQYHYDPELAKKMLLEEGFQYRDNGLLYDADGNQVTWDFTGMEGSEKITSILTIYKENLADIGISIDLKFIDFAALLQTIGNTFDYDQALIGWGSSGGAGDPHGSKALFQSKGKFHMWYPEQPSPVTEWEKRLDEIVELQEQELDFEKRRAYIYELQEIFAEQIPLQFLLNGDAYSGIQNKWGNVKVPPTGILHWNLDELYQKK